MDACAWVEGGGGGGGRAAQFMGIVPLPEQSARNTEASRAQLQNSLGALDVPDVPAMGIAPSMPTNLAADGLDIPDLSAHPYALLLSPHARAGPVPVAAAYAGPHPTSPNFAQLIHILAVHQHSCRWSDVCERVDNVLKSQNDLTQDASISRLLDDPHFRL